MAAPPDFSRVLITGARGFIGRHATKEFERRGFSVTAVSRGDIPQLHGIDVVLHLAGHAHVMRPRPRDLVAFRAINVDATRALAADAARAGVKRFIFLSSAGLFPSDASPETVDAYLRSKADGEEAVRTVLSGTSTTPVIVRSPMVYGPGAPGTFSRLTALVARRLPLPFGEIGNKRSMVSIWNLCDFLVVVSIHPSVCFSIDPWPVSDGHDVSTSELVEAIAASRGFRPRLYRVSPRLLEIAAAAIGRREEMHRLFGSSCIDIGASRLRLGWTPPIPFKEGISRSVIGDAA